MKQLELTGLVIAGLLFFIWPIPHTISIRYVLVLLTLLLFGYIAYRNGPLAGGYKALRPPFVILTVLTIWMVMVALFISSETAWSLKEIRGQWLMAFAAFIAAVLISLSTIKGELLTWRNLLSLLFWVLVVHVVYVDLYAVVTFLITGQMPTRVGGLTPGMDKSSYLSNYLLMILGVELFFRAVHKRSLIPVNNPILIFILLLTVFSIYLEAVRNGTVSALILVCTMIALYVYNVKVDIKKSAILALVLVALITFGFISYKKDPRWKTFIEGFPVALDTQKHKAWLDPYKYPHPRLKSGAAIHGSNFDRIAWFKEGTVLVWENPLGLGFGRRAFGHGIQMKYNEGGNLHSHSGIIDLAVGTGFPGIILWFVLIFYLLFSSFRAFIKVKSYFGMLLFFIVASYGLRMVVDSIIRDHMLQQFMFLAGGFFTLMLLETNKIEGNPSNSD